MRTPENKTLNRRVVSERNPRLLGHRHSPKHGISSKTIRKIQSVQSLKATNFVSRKRFSKEFLQLINQGEDIIDHL